MDAHRLPTRSAFGVIGSLAILVVAAVSAQAASPGARLITAKGLVEILNAPSGAWVAAASPAVLPPGSSLRTGSKSEAVLELDGAVVTLYDTSLIRIPAEAAPASTASQPLRHPVLDSGRALFDVTPRTDRAPFSVRTPTIVAGVKGTAFEVVATATQQAVYVWRGLVEVTSLVDRADVQLVSAGHFTMLDQLHLIPPIDIPNHREDPTSLEPHHATVSTARRDAPAAGPTPMPEKLAETVPFDAARVDSKSAADASLSVEGFGAMPADRDPLIGLWGEADDLALHRALDHTRDLQTVVSTGDLRAPASQASKLGTTGSGVTHAVTDSQPSNSSVQPREVDDLDDLSEIESTLTTTVDSPVTSLSSTVDSTDTSLSSTLAPVVTETTTRVESTLSRPLGLLGF